MTKISAVIITNNEVDCIERALRSLDFCDEIVVADSGSTDATVAVCGKYNCRMFTKAFDGFGPYKQFAVSMARNDWVLSLDADESVSGELKREIVSLFSAEAPDVAGFYIPRSLVFLGRQLRFGGEYRKKQLRLFNRNAGAFNTEKVHEKVCVSGKTASLKNQILHYSYDSIRDYFEKFNTYTTVAAQSLFEKKKKISAFNVIARFPLAFIKIYFIKGCFLDGYAGAVWSLFSSLYPVVKFAKLCELAALEKGEMRAGNGQPAP
jgi:glycosyltransferase involved in cell wall biosynthesis